VGRLGGWVTNLCIFVWMFLFLMFSSRVMTKKKQLTELLHMIWGAVRGKDFLRCDDLYGRIEEYRVELRKWKEKEVEDVQVRNVIEPFVLVMTTQIAKVKEKLKMMDANRKKKLKKRAQGLKVKK
jgi:hypothetical protein